MRKLPATQASTASTVTRTAAPGMPASDDSLVAEARAAAEARALECDPSDR